jgi:hypothetical protein
MEGLYLGSKNMSFIFRILCLFTFYKHKQWFFVRCNFSCSGLWFYLPSEIHVCLCIVCCCVGRTKSAISQPCAVRLSWNLVESWGWYPRLACLFWFQDLIIFYIVNKQKDTKNAKIAKIAVLQNLRFLNRAELDWSETWWGDPDQY